MAQASDISSYASYEEHVLVRPRKVVGEDRWPPLYTALFVLVASGLLWSMIIGAFWWLLA